MCFLLLPLWSRSLSVCVCVCVWECLSFTLFSPRGLGTLNLPQLSGRELRSFWLLLLPHVTSLDCSMKSIDCRNVLIVVVVLLVAVPWQKVKSFDS